jgi:uncharacterized ferritin-like protein (DUF455 family)
VEIVKIIQNDEHRHFKAGWKWFFKVCQLKKLDISEEIRSINLKFNSAIALPPKLEGNSRI